MNVIYGTLVKTNKSPDASFHFFLNFDFGDCLWGKSAKQWPKMTKDDVCLTPYFRSHALYDCDFWYT